MDVLVAVQRCLPQVLAAQRRHKLLSCEIFFISVSTSVATTLILQVRHCTPSCSSQTIMETLDRTGLRRIKTQRDWLSLNQLVIQTNSADLCLEQLREILAFQDAVGMRKRGV